MRILKLMLLAYGPFTDAVIDFQGGETGIHMVYGPNEAGKSSALRGLREALYSISERSSDDFIHPYAKMRVGALLRHSDGTTLDFVRRKGRVNTLRSGDDSAPLDESLLARFLGRIDAGLFGTMFSMGHDDLIRGGGEILLGGGQLGHALFAAGSGISDLRKVQTALQGDAETLFKPNASKPRINESIARFKEIQKGLRDAQLPGEEWERHDQALRDAGTRRANVALVLENKVKEHHRLARIKEALPLIGRRTELHDERLRYADVILLPDDFSERRRGFLTSFRLAETRRAQAIEAVQEIEAAIAELTVDPAVLDRGDLIEGLYRELGSYQKAARDRDRLVTQRDLLWAEAAEILSGLRQDLTLEETEKLRLKKTDVLRIRDLGTRYERLMTRLETGKAQMSSLSRAVASIEAKMADVALPLAVGHLGSVVERGAKVGDMEGHYRSEREQVEAVLSGLKGALRRQTLWSGTLEALEGLPLPSIETVDVFSDRFEKAERRVEQLRSQAEDLQATLLEIEGEERELALQGEVPTEADLREARNLRQEGWRLIRGMLEKGEAVAAETPASVMAIRTQGLSETYERSVERADEIADRLRREADRVAKKAKLAADHETRTSQAATVRDMMAVAAAELEKIGLEWRNAWEPSAVSPASPREMRAWLQDQRAILEKWSEARERSFSLDALHARIQAHRAEIADAFVAMSLPPPKGQETLSDLVEKGRKIIEEQETIRSGREKLLTEKKKRTEELSHAAAQVASIETEISSWGALWEEAIRPLGLDGTAMPEQANAVMDDLKTLFEKVREAGDRQKRVAGIDRDAQTFTERVKALCIQAATDLEGSPSEAAIVGLHARLTRAREARSKLDSLEKQRGQEEKRLREAERAISECRSQLEAMCTEAGCDSYEALSEVEARSSKRKEIESELKTLDERLRGLSGGVTVDAFVRAAAAVDPDTIDSRMENLNEVIRGLEEEKSSLDQAIGAETNELGRMDGGAVAALLAEEGQRVLGRLSSDAEHYARLKLASAVLSRAIERFRRRHQGPMVGITSERFAQLTGGSFEGVRVEFNDEGQAVLVGVRPGGKSTVGVEGMSDGTADQLYLALRLAGIESYLEANEPMPLIFDDILIRFDDDRAGAALAVLRGLSEKTQVIFFTHHRHLVDLAEKRIPPGGMIKHVL
jgi:uncharacterized protein YhaN